MSAAMKQKGYYWGRAKCLGGKIADWEMLWCDGTGWWHVCEYGVTSDPIPETKLSHYFAKVGQRLEPPQTDGTP